MFFFVFCFVFFIKPAERSDAKKTLQNLKKLAISVKLDLQSCALMSYIFIKRYTWSINLETFVEI